MHETRRALARRSSAPWQRLLWVVAATALLAACTDSDTAGTPSKVTLASSSAYLDPLCQDIAARTDPEDPQKHAEQLLFCDTMDIAVTDAIGPAEDDPGNPWGTTRQERELNVRVWLVPAIRSEIQCREPGATCLGGSFAP